MLPIGRLRLRGYEDPAADSIHPSGTANPSDSLGDFRSPLMMGGDLPTLDAATLTC